MGGILTAIGEAKMAGSIGGTAVNLTTVRIGDGNNAAVTPVRTMTDLVRRVGSALPITASARDPDNASMWRITTEIPAGSGPFNLREIAVFDSAGDMIAIASHPLVEFLGPGGDAVSIITDIVFPVSGSANVNISITPSVMTPIARHPRGFFMVVDDLLNAPPAPPAIGATYVIGAAPTGAWAGRAGDIAQWTGLDWSLITAPVGHLVVDQSEAEGSANRYLRRSGSGWVSAAASETAQGVVRLATALEAVDVANNINPLTPARLLPSLYQTIKFNGQCELVLSGSDLLLRPKDGNQVLVDGAPRTLPVGGITLSATGNAPNTVYYIYAYMASGVLTLEKSTTGRAVHTDGTSIKSGDPTRAIVGVARSNGSGAWVDEPSKRFVRSFFNRKGLPMWSSFTANRSTSALEVSKVELNSEIRCEFVCFSDDSIDVDATGYFFNSGNFFTYCSVAFDGTDTDTGTITATYGTNGSSLNAARNAGPGLNPFTDGYHYATLVGYVNGGTGTWGGGASNTPSCAIHAQLG